MFISTPHGSILVNRPRKESGTENAICRVLFVCLSVGLGTTPGAIKQLPQALCFGGGITPSRAQGTMQCCKHIEWTVHKAKSLIPWSINPVPELYLWLILEKASIDTSWFIRIKGLGRRSRVLIILKHNIQHTAHGLTRNSVLVAKYMEDSQ